MSYSASQFEDLIDAIHRKNGRKPPKDQAELLEKDESWIYQLRKTPHGAANVPDHVLQTVTAAHEARVKQTASRALQSVKDKEQEVPEPSSSHATPTSSSERHVSDLSTWPDERHPRRDELHVSSVQPVKDAEQEVAKSSSQSGTPGSSPERQFSGRSVSPERRPTREQIPGSSVVEETPYPQHARAAYRRAPLGFSRNKEAFPLPSQDEEEELEVQLPCGENVPQGDANGNFRYPYLPASQPIQQQSTIQVTNTPPCAQPDHESVPETVIAETTRRTEVAKRQRPVKRFKPINLGSDSPIKPKGDGMATRGSRMRSLKHLEVAETHETIVSSSIVAATLTQTQTQKAASTAQEPAEDMPEDMPEDMADIETPVSAAEEAQSSSEELLSAKSHFSGGEEHQPGQQGGESMEDSEDQAVTPFRKFCAAYPDYCESYNGSRPNFVNTCVYLEFLRDQRALRDYLYDDFIRFFSCNFLDYVNNAGPGQEPLPAIERYNIQSGQPLYNRQIVNNANLDRVLTFYKLEASEIRILQAQYEQDQAPEAAVIRFKATGSESASPAPLPEEVQDPMNVDEPSAEVKQSVAPNHQVSAQDKVLDERPISPPVPRSITSVVRRANSACKQAIPVAESARSPQASSPLQGRRTVSAAPPSSMRSNAPVASQYIQRLATMSASTGEDAARQHREKVRAALRRKRASASARGSSSKAGSVA